MNEALNRILDLILGALDLLRFWVVLNEFERGVILRFGCFNRELGPGIHWRAPLRIEELFWVNIRQRAGNPWERTATTKDGTPVTVGCGWTAEIADATFVLLHLAEWEDVAPRVVSIAVSRAIHEVTDEQFRSDHFLDLAKDKTAHLLGAVGLRLCYFGITERAFTPTFRIFKGAS